MEGRAARKLVYFSLFLLFVAAAATGGGGKHALNKNNSLSRALSLSHNSQKVTLLTKLIEKLIPRFLLHRVPLSLLPSHSLSQPPLACFVFFPYVFPFLRTNFSSSVASECQFALLISLIFLRVCLFFSIDFSFCLNGLGSINQSL